MKLEEGKNKLPDGWRWVKLGEVCDVTKLAGFEYTEYVEYVSQGEYIALRAQNIRNRGLDLQNIVYITKEVASHLSRSKLSIGDVAMTFIGVNIGEAAWIDKNDTYYCAPNIAKLTPNPQLLNYEFLTRLIHSQVVRRQIEAINESTAQPSLSMQNIRNFLIPLPPLDEQKRIAAILDEQMEAVERSRQATLAQLEAAKALPSAYLRAVFNSPEAQKWERKTLEELCQSHRGITYGVVLTGDPVPGGIPTVRGGDIQGFQVRHDSLKCIARELSARFSRTVLQGDEVLLAIRGSVGAVADVDSQLIGANVSREVAVIPLKKEINPKYTVFALSSPSSQSIISAKIQGAAQRGINLSDVDKLQIPIPEIKEQNKIAETLTEQMTEVQKLRKALEEEFNAINKLPATFLRQAFNGEL